MPEFDVVGIGLNATDTVIQVREFPAPGGKAPFQSERYSAGGQVASAMVACARLGLRAKYIGAVGDDERGRIQLESLRESGVDIGDLRLRQNCANQSAYIIVDESTGERTVFWHRAECLALKPEEVGEEQIVCARLLHVDGHDTAAVAHAAQIARRHGIPVTADLDTVYGNLETLLPWVDYLIADSEFPKRWTGLADPHRALDAIRQRFGMRLAAMTLGRDGALACTANGFAYSPAFAVNCVDTTGAGDVFHGAFCYSVLQEMPVAEALAFSNAMAALNCTAHGARGRIASAEEARTLMARGTRRAHRF